MRGKVSQTSQRASVEQVFAWLDALSFPTATATVEPSRAVGRTLLFELRADRGLPSTDRAVIAGVAVRARDTEGAGPYNPLPLRAIAVQAGETMPAGCDAVMPADLIEAGHALEAVAAGEYVVAAESQIRPGALVFPAGHRLRPQDVAVLTELDVRLVTVRFGLLVTGDTPDHLDDLEMALLWRDYTQWEDEGDIILTGHDLPGDRWEISAVALRPGGACRFGRRDGAPVIRMPDDPLAYTIVYELFVARLLRRMSGLGPACRQEDRVLTAKIVSTIGYTDVVLVRLDGVDATPLPGIETGGAASLARADGFVIVPPTREGIGPGELVCVHLFGP